MANLVQVSIMYFGEYIQLSICDILLQHVLRKDLAKEDFVRGATFK